MGYSIGLSPKNYEISPSPSKNHIFYTILHNHVKLYVYLFYIYIILHGYIKSYKCIYFYIYT
jgi:hypothetical protein